MCVPRVKTLTWEQYGLRLLLNAMKAHIPAVVQQQGELCVGGDVRRKGNKWLRTAYAESGIKKVPRQPDIRKVIVRLMHELLIATRYLNPKQCAVCLGILWPRPQVGCTEHQRMAGGTRVTAANSITIT